jgi:hypothetical protein
LTACTMSAQLLGFMSRNIKSCTPKIKSQAYRSLIRPILMHGISGWHPTTDCNIKKMQGIQNRASRFVFGKNCTRELDKRILSIKSLLSYTDILYFYRCRNNRIDCNITDCVRSGRAIRGENYVNA